MKTSILIATFMLLFSCFATGQMVTGIWHGKINRQKVEVKIIQNGDSLTGTSYYYESGSQYRRYAIKGYFDASSNETVWWDDQLIEEKNGRNAGRGKMALLSRADFNCPGDGRMMLDGKAGPIDGESKGPLHLDKGNETAFPDEWDYVINNYTQGASDPYIIDSIGAIALQTTPEEQPVTIERPITKPDVPTVSTARIEKVPQVVPKTITPFIPPTIEEKFLTRKKVLVKEIPLSGDSIELRFYDNAEIDGDSISLFMNEKLVFQHIRLQGSAYTIKFSVSELSETNDLTMVAENLGSIPPNTSFMVALVGDQRYEARLESTEGSSAMIRFVKSIK